MQREEVLDWNDIQKIGVGAFVVSVVGAVFAYVRSIGTKADKADVQKQIQEMRVELKEEIERVNRRHSAWESRSERFATREMVDTLNAKFERMETRQDAAFEKINSRLDKLIESRS